MTPANPRAKARGLTAKRRRPATAWPHRGKWLAFALAGAALFGGASIAQDRESDFAATKLGENLAGTSIAQDRGSYSGMLRRFLLEQWELTDDREALREDYRLALPVVREQAKAAWRVQNQPTIDAQRLLARDLAASAPRLPLPLVSEVRVSRSASPELVDFFVGAAELNNAMAEFKNPLLAAAPEARREAVQAWTREHAKEFDAQARRAKAAAAQTAALPREIPDEPVLPKNLSPAEKRFLLESAALAREDALLKDSLRELSPEKRTERLREWKLATVARRDAIALQARELAKEQAKRP